ADCSAKRILHEGRLCDRHVWTQLIRRAVERRPAERIRRRPFIGILCACPAAPQHEPAATAQSPAPPAPPPARSTTPPPPPAATALGSTESAAKSLIADGSETRRKLSGGRIKLSKVDGLLTIVQDTAIEIDSAPSSGDHHSVRLRILE